MLKRFIFSYLLGLDALIRLMATVIVFLIFWAAAAFIDLWLGKWLAAFPVMEGMTKVFLLILLAPFAAAATMSVGSKSLLQRKKETAGADLNAQAGPPPSPQSLPGGR